MSDNEQSLPETHVELVAPDPVVNPVEQHEKAAFVRYVQEQGQAIPSNFKSAEDWFGSLMEARKGYTQARQEIASLKKQYNSTAAANPNYKEPAKTENTVVKTEEPKSIDLSGIPDELKIQSPTGETKPNPAVTQADWVKWGGEIDRNGTVSDATKKEIKAKMGADDVVIEQMIKGRQALQKESFNAAANVVGGAEQLKTLFNWAQHSLPTEEVSAINRALQTSAYPSVLLGLKAKMQAASAPTPTLPENREPKVKLDRVNTSQVSQQVQVFNSQAQQNAAISDPRFRTDPNFRKSVEAMIVNSTKYGFKGR